MTQHSHTVVAWLGQVARPMAVYIHAHVLPAGDEHQHPEYEALERRLMRREAAEADAKH